MQKLSMRLQSVADFVSCGNTLADVGTDHGYVPIYLVQQGIVPSAIAMDVRPGPLERAREHIARAGLQKRIQLRLSDGLEKLGPQEAESVVIAGMGGMLTIRILQEAGHRLEAVKELVLEPQSDVWKVRRFLREQGFWIQKEQLVCEEGKFYPILLVRPGQAQAGLSGHQAKAAGQEAEWDPIGQLKQRFSEKNVMELCDRYGEYTISHSHPMLLPLLDRDLRRLQKIEDSLQGQEGQLERIRDVQGQMEALRILRDCLFGNVETKSYRKE